MPEFSQAHPPTVLCSWLNVLLMALDNSGGSSSAALEQAGLSRDGLQSPDARISVAESRRLWEAAQAQINNEAFGLDVPRHSRQTTFHALGYAFMASDTMLSALERVARFGSMVSDAASVELCEKPEWVEVRWHPAAPPFTPAESAMEAMLSMILRSCRKIRGATFSPVEVDLCRAKPALIKPFEDFFGCPVAFGKRGYRMRFSRRDVEATLPWGNAELARFNDQVVEEYLSRLSQASVSQKVHRLLAQDLVNGQRTQADYAKALGMSVRSMQRKLGEEGETFNGVLSAVRSELAQGYLRQTPRPSLTEVAFMLGFSDTSSFSRAFQRWTGVAPSQFR